MASVSVSHLILFIASMIIAAGVAGVFTTSVDQLAGAIDDQGVQVSDNVRTSISIISDSGSENIYNSTEDNTTLYIKNIGTQNLNADKRQIDVLVDGEFVTDSDITIQVLDTADEFTWGTNQVLELTIQRTLEAGDHRAKVIVNGDEEIIEFRVNNA
jgi:flagellar protein FlaG